MCGLKCPLFMFKSIHKFRMYFVKVLFVSKLGVHFFARVFVHYK